MTFYSQELISTMEQLPTETLQEAFCPSFARHYGPPESVEECAKLQPNGEPITGKDYTEYANKTELVRFVNRWNGTRPELTGNCLDKESLIKHIVHKKLRNNPGDVFRDPYVQKPVCMDKSSREALCVIAQRRDYIPVTLLDEVKRIMIEDMDDIALQCKDLRAEAEHVLTKLEEEVGKPVDPNAKTEIAKNLRSLRDRYFLVKENKQRRLVEIINKHFSNSIPIGSKLQSLRPVVQNAIDGINATARKFKEVYDVDIRQVLKKIPYEAVTEDSSDNLLGEIHENREKIMKDTTLTTHEKNVMLDRLCDSEKRILLHLTRRPHNNAQSSSTLTTDLTAQPNDTSSLSSGAAPKRSSDGAAPAQKRPR